MAWFFNHNAPTTTALPAPATMMVGMTMDNVSFCV
jgi:hypothetical protein